jgi:hypothetical protein
MDDADPGLESCAKSVYYPVRGADAAAVMKFRLHKIRDTLCVAQKERGFVKDSMNGFHQGQER